MIGAASTQGISFVCPGRIVAVRPDRRSTGGLVSPLGNDSGFKTVVSDPGLAPGLTRRRLSG